MTALAAAGLLAWPAGRALEGTLSRLLGEGRAPLARPLASLAAFAGLYLAAALLARLALRALRGGQPPGPTDRAAGALLGGAQAGAGLWALLSLAVLWGRPVGPAGFRLDPGRGDLAAFARERNLVELLSPAGAALLRERAAARGEATDGGLDPLERARRAAEAAAAAARRTREAVEAGER